MKSCFEGCCSEGTRCEDVERSSRGLFANFEASTLEAQTDMCAVAVCWYKSNTDFRNRWGENGKVLLMQKWKICLNVRFRNCV